MDTRYFRASDGWLRRVPSGFSWSAFFLSPTWAFANRAWVLGILLSIASAPVELLSHLNPVHGIGFGFASFIVSLSFMYITGRYGHAWLAWSLKKQGYEEVSEHAT